MRANQNALDQAAFAHLSNPAEELRRNLDPELLGESDFAPDAASLSGQRTHMRMGRPTGSIDQEKSSYIELTTQLGAETSTNAATNAPDYYTAPRGTGYTSATTAQALLGQKQRSIASNQSQVNKSPSGYPLRQRIVSMKEINEQAFEQDGGSSNPNVTIDLMTPTREKKIRANARLTQPRDQYSSSRAYAQDSRHQTATSQVSSAGRRKVVSRTQRISSGGVYPSSIRNGNDYQLYLNQAGAGRAQNAINANNKIYSRMTQEDYKRKIRTSHQNRNSKLGERPSIATQPYTKSTLSANMSAVPQRRVMRQSNSIKINMNQAGSSPQKRFQLKSPTHGARKFQSTVGHRYSTASRQQQHFLPQAVHSNVKLDDLTVNENFLRDDEAQRQEQEPYLTPASSMGLRARQLMHEERIRNLQGHLSVCNSTKDLPDSLGNKTFQETAQSSNGFNVPAKKRKAEGSRKGQGCTLLNLAHEQASRMPSFTQSVLPSKSGSKLSNFPAEPLDKRYLNQVSSSSFNQPDSRLEHSLNKTSLLQSGKAPKPKPESEDQILSLNVSSAKFPNEEPRANSRGVASRPQTRSKASSAGQRLKPVATNKRQKNQLILFTNGDQIKLDLTEQHLEQLAAKRATLHKSKPQVQPELRLKSMRSNDTATRRKKPLVLKSLTQARGLKQAPAPIWDRCNMDIATSQQFPESDDMAMGSPDPQTLKYAMDKSEAKTKERPNLGQYPPIADYQVQQVKSILEQTNRAESTLDKEDARQLRTHGSHQTDASKGENTLVAHSYIQDLLTRVEQKQGQQQSTDKQLSATLTVELKNFENLNDGQMMNRSQRIEDGVLLPEAASQKQLAMHSATINSSILREKRSERMDGSRGLRASYNPSHRKQVSINEDTLSHQGKQISAQKRRQQARPTSHDESAQNHILIKSTLMADHLLHPGNSRQSKFHSRCGSHSSNVKSYDDMHSHKSPASRGTAKKAPESPKWLYRAGPFTKYGLFSKSVANLMGPQAPGTKLIKSTSLGPAHLNAQQSRHMEKIYKRPSKDRNLSTDHEQSRQTKKGAKKRRVKNKRKSASQSKRDGASVGGKRAFVCEDCHRRSLDRYSCGASSKIEAGGFRVSRLKQAYLENSTLSNGSILDALNHSLRPYAAGPRSFLSHSMISSPSSYKKILNRKFDVKRDLHKYSRELDYRKSERKMKLFNKSAKGRNLTQMRKQVEFKAVRCNKWDAEREALKNVDWQDSDLYEAYKESKETRTPIEKVLQRFATLTCITGDKMFTDVELQYYIGLVQKKDCKMGSDEVKEENRHQIVLEYFNRSLYTLQALTKLLKIDFHYSRLFKKYETSYTVDTVLLLMTRARKMYHAIEMILTILKLLEKLRLFQIQSAKPDIERLTTGKRRSSAGEEHPTVKNLKARIRVHIKSFLAQHTLFPVQFKFGGSDWLKLLRNGGGVEPEEEDGEQPDATLSHADSHNRIINLKVRSSGGKKSRRSQSAKSAACSICSREPTSVKKSRTPGKPGGKKKERRSKRASVVKVKKPQGMTLVESALNQDLKLRALDRKTVVAERN